MSFEPVAGPVALVAAAVGPEPGEAVIHLSARDDSSSLLPITARQNALFPGTAEAGTATIRVARLADHVPAEAIAPPALLKLDVQGLRGHAALCPPACSCGGPLAWAIACRSGPCPRPEPHDQSHRCVSP